MPNPTVSVVLVTRNGMDTLPSVLDGVAAQARPVEIVAVDSGSEDGTLELLERRVQRLERNQATAFNHGATRNRAIALSRGELVVLLVQDAVPADELWLDELIRPCADGAVAGAYSRQLPALAASRLTRWNLERWVAAADEPRTQRIDDPEQWSSLPPVERFRCCVFDNVSSCIRRSVWEQHPFPTTDLAEDLAWARTVLFAGHRLCFAAASRVRHSHERSARYELHRSYLAHRRLYQLFGLRTIPTRGQLLRAAATNLRAHARVLRRGEGPTPGLGEIARALTLAVAWPYGQYLGAKAAVEGRELLRTEPI